MENEDSLERAKHGVLKLLDVARKTSLEIDSRIDPNRIDRAKIVASYAWMSRSKLRSFLKKPRIDPKQIGFADASYDYRKMYNPFRSSESDIDAAIDALQQFDAIDCKLPDRGSGELFSITDKGVQLLHQLETRLETMTEGKKNSVPVAVESNDTNNNDSDPWTDLVPMARKYAESIFPEGSDPKTTNQSKRPTR